MPMHELGWLKREDRPSGVTWMRDGFGDIAVIIPTEQIAPHCRNGDRIRCRLTE